jgi:hypothetical protein
MLAQVLTEQTWPSVALAFLNVVQTVALAYLAADRHAVRSARNAAKPRGVRGSVPPSDR